MDTRLRRALRLSNKVFAAMFVCSLPVFLVSCGHTQAAPPPIPMSAVMDAVRGYGPSSKFSAVTAKKAKSEPESPLSDDPLNNFTSYKAYVSSFFAQNDFAQLEKEAREARAKKSRMKGGVWKLAVFYEALSNPSADSHARESDWQALLASLGKWIAAYPESATARVALAEAYVNYAWAARGSGYANTVSDPAWDLFGQRVELGKAALLEAARLKEKCPEWFSVMQSVAKAQGWDKEEARELLDRAVAFEPTYYLFYRSYASFLLPKWYGEEGDLQQFAEEMSDNLPEPDASIVYFEIARTLACQCDPQRNSLERLSWPKIKQGYAEMQRLYGTTDYKMNSYAYMSYKAGDKEEARDAFALLGDNWEQEVWLNRQNFQRAKDWALEQ